MTTLSRKCVPFTPFDSELSQSTIAIVTAGGVHLKAQEAFNIADELGDLGYREIPPEVDSSDLMVTHHHYDHSDADEDINVVFPIDVLRDLQAEGFRAGSAPYVVFLDEEDAPDEELLSTLVRARRATQADAVTWAAV